MRRKAAAIRAVQAGAEFGAPIDAAASPDDRARAILMQADRALREIGGELHRKAARQAIREGFDLLTDFAPIVGDIKAVVEARDYLRQAEAAEKAGDSDKAAKLRGLAGISIATILPWMRGLRAVKAVARIVRVSRKLKAEADPVLVRLDALAPGRIRDRLPNRRTPAVPDNHPDLDRFKGDFAHSPTTLDFRAKFEADAEWQKHRARTKGRDEQGREYKGEPINGLKEGDVARIGDVRLFERNGESYARGLDDIERKIGRKPKEGKGLPVDNKPHLEKDVIYGESRDGGRVIEIAVRDKNTGKELFRNSVYYSRYGVPEFEAKGSFWLPPEKMASKPDGQRIWIQDRLREMAQDRKRHRELRRMGFTARQIEILRVKGYKKDLGVEIHHELPVGKDDTGRLGNAYPFCPCRRRKAVGNKTTTFGWRSEMKLEEMPLYLTQELFENPLRMPTVSEVNEYAGTLGVRFPEKYVSFVVQYAGHQVAQDVGYAVIDQLFDGTLDAYLHDIGLFLHYDDERDYKYSVQNKHLFYAEEFACRISYRSLQRMSEAKSGSTLASRGYSRKLSLRTSMAACRTMTI